MNELEEFFLLLQEDFETCDPLQWWVGRCSQFPNLSHFARDILSMPGMFKILARMFNLLRSSLLGSAIAVERIFSGGRDMISLCRASLKPDTIRTLILVKQRLRLARQAIQDIVGC